MWKAQQELRHSVDSLRRDVSHSMDPHQNPLFEVILESLDLIRAESNKSHIGREDLAEAIATALTEHEALKNLEDRIAQQVANVLEEVQAVREHQEVRGETQLALIREELNSMKFGANLMDIVHHLQSQLGEVFLMTQSLNAHSTKTIHDVEELQLEWKSSYAQTIEDVKILQMESQKINAEIGPGLEMTLAKCLQEMPVNVDLSGINMQINKTRHVVESDFEQMLDEVAKIQKALNVDFSRIIEDMEAVTETVGHVRTSMICNKPADFAEAVTQKPSAPQRKRVRVRDYWAQTDIKEFTESWMQTDDALWKAANRPHHKSHKPKKHHVRGEDSLKLKEALVRHSTKPKAAKVFGDAQAMKRQVRRALIQPQYNVADFYKSTGIFQKLARSIWFENLTLIVIFLNAIWIGVDTDHNDEALLINADAVFQVAENVFCTFFVVEIFIRFLAFQRKRNSLRDPWFVFDAVLVVMMAIETWIISGIFMAMGYGRSEADTPMFGDEGSIFRIARLAKIARISRLARLLRAMPEVVILIKTIGVAARVVLVFLTLWVTVIFIFGVTFRQITDDSSIGDQYFSSVPGSMNTLLLSGLFPENESMVNEIGGTHPLLWVLIMLFILTVSLTLMHMLLAVLVEIISVVSVAEKEGMMVSHVSSQFRVVLQNLEISMPISKIEFQKLLIEPAVISILSHECVDVMGLVDMLDIIYQDIEVDGAGGLSFEKLVDLVLNLRGTNAATVKDLQEQLRLNRQITKDVVNHLLEEVNMEFSIVKNELKELKETQIRALEDGGDEEESEEEYEVEDAGSLLLRGGTKGSRLSGDSVKATKSILKTPFAPDRSDDEE